MTVSLFIVSLAFLGGFLMILGVNLVVDDMYLRDQRRIAEQEQRRMVDRERRRARQEASLRPRPAELGDIAVEVDREMPGKRTVGMALLEILEQSGLHWKLRDLFILSLVCGIVVGGISGLAIWSVPAGVAIAIPAATMPLLFVMYYRRRRLATLCSQLPDVLDLMSRILRAGQTVTQAMHTVSKEFKPPIAAEFAHCYEQQNLGLGQEIALRDLARRTGLLEIKIFVLALLVQRKTGGNMAEILDTMAGVVRERFKLRGKIRAMTAEGRLQAIFLLALPPIMFFVMLGLNYDYASKLFQVPWLIAVAVVWMFIGAIWIRKLVNFDF